MTTPAQPDAPAAPAQTVTDTPSGILVGADAPSPKPTFSPVQTNNTSGANTNPASIFTAEDIQKARQQEKDKLYPQLEEMRKTLAELQKERDEKLEAERKQREEAEEALRKQREDEMSAKELLEQQKQEFEQRFQALQAEREQERQVLQMEREFQELQAYKATALAQAADDIIPELASELTSTNHTSREEIDAHIARLRDTSSRIIEQMQAAVTAQRAGMRGAPVTAPPAGPLDTYSGHDPAWEAANNGSLTFEDYVKNRDKLLSGVSRNTGLYG